MILYVNLFINVFFFLSINLARLLSFSVFKKFLVRTALGSCDFENWMTFKLILLLGVAVFLRVALRHQERILIFVKWCVQEIFC